jgi:hypothetical protein
MPPSRKLRISGALSCFTTYRSSSVLAKYAPLLPPLAFHCARQPTRDDWMSVTPGTGVADNNLRIGCEIARAAVSPPTPI